MTRSDPLAAAVIDHRAAVLTVADLAALRAARCMWESPRIAHDEVRVPNR